MQLHRHRQEWVTEATVTPQISMRQIMLGHPCTVHSIDQIRIPIRSLPDTHRDSCRRLRAPITTRRTCMLQLRTEPPIRLITATLSLTRCTNIHTRLFREQPRTRGLIRSKQYPLFGIAGEIFKCISMLEYLCPYFLLAVLCCGIFHC
jgi:hypothetical protein